MNKYIVSYMDIRGILKFVGVKRDTVQLAMKVIQKLPHVDHTISAFKVNKYRKKVNNGKIQA